MAVTFQFPKLRTLAAHAAPTVAEATVAPLVLFGLVYNAAGLWPAIATALVWDYAAIARHLFRSGRVPAMLALSALLATARTVVAAVVSSSFMYFLGPVAATVCLAAAFLSSAVAGRPIAQRLAADLVPFPDGFCEQPSVQRYFAGITALWGAELLANAGATVWLLLHEPVGVFVVAHNVAGWALTGVSFAISVVWFRVAMARHGLLAGVEPRSQIAWSAVDLQAELATA